ncbi:adenylate kinase [Volvox carteri f. nagariensis]|uniref:adenylate kinase n=1 Tax=Volvox carteri f. nagariensis TaxID=3068 RepID=D8U2Q7_VOLCA|nr:adenylate kinase [Volvox carteri f. nagariensis]EFJ45941.1 adenylate kinase [Volvox carteri f. nagariensis]|eukprot:XP_002953019.1 adenylate kinase [Volvox carteri f. nagariensis]
MDKVTIVFVLGAPGSGKRTQCEKIVENYGWTHLSTGDLLREEVLAGTELGQQVNEIMASGQMVPTDLILEMLTNAMASSGSSRFLIDGFPRTLDQLMEFQTQVKPCDGVLVFSVPEEVAVERLLARGVTSGRVDDNEDAIRERMNLFWSDSQPVIEFLADSGGNLHEVDSAAPEEEVFAAVEPFMDEMDELGESTLWSVGVCRVKKGENNRYYKLHIISPKGKNVIMHGEK